MADQRDAAVELYSERTTSSGLVLRRTACSDRGFPVRSHTSVRAGYRLLNVHLGANRRYIVFGSLLAIALAMASYCSPRYTRVRLSSGRQFDVIALSVDSRSAPDTYTSTKVVVLNYYAQAKLPRQRVDEADEILQVAQRAADSLGVTQIEIQQTYPIVSRWTGIVRGFVWKYDRTPGGAWRRF